MELQAEVAAREKEEMLKHKREEQKKKKQQEAEAFEDPEWCVFPTTACCTRRGWVASMYARAEHDQVMIDNRADWPLVLRDTG